MRTDDENPEPVVIPKTKTINNPIVPINSPENKYYIVITYLKTPGPLLFRTIPKILWQQISSIIIEIKKKKF